MTDDLQIDGERAGFGCTAGLGTSPVIVIVDMCRAHFEEGSPLYTGVPDVAGAAHAAQPRIAALVRS